MKQKLALEGLTLALVMLVCQLILILAMSAVWFYLTGASAGYPPSTEGDVLGSSSLVYCLGAAPQGDNRECGPGFAGLLWWGWD